MNEYSLASAVDRVRIFQCPTCNETLNTKLQQCPACGHNIDPTTVEAAAELAERISQAISDASYLRIVAVSALGFLGLSFVPFLGWVGEFGGVAVAVAVPVLAIRWWVRIRAVSSNDRDLRQARKSVMVALGIWAVLSPVAVFKVLLVTGLFEILARRYF